MAKQLDIEIKVGIFVALGLGLVMIAVLVLGSVQQLAQSKRSYMVHFKSVEGLIPGATVVVGGVQAGTVDEVKFEKGQQEVRVELSVREDAAQWIRKESKAEISTQGVLGDKYVTISPGASDQSLLAEHSEIPALASTSMTQFISKGDQLIISLEKVATSMERLLKDFESENQSKIFFSGLKKSVGHLDAILEKIDNGTGTLGALVNDPGLYEDAKALMGGANRNRLVRNLVRQTIKEGKEGEEGESKKSGRIDSERSATKLRGIDFT
ncbi:MlaD family protein [Bdellovibrionota bacterium FG-2]